MKILLVNKFYYRRGGDCVVTMNTERLLRAAGHEVRVYAMRYPENIETETSSYFASEVAFAGGISTKVNALKRTLGMGDIKRSFKTMLDDFNPDVVHLHNIHSYLSPVVAQLAKEHGCRVVWTMHDYKLVCPAYTMLCNGEVCTSCVGRGKSGVMKQRCMKGSLVASAVAWMEALKWNRKKLDRYTDAFVCPSRFMGQMLAKDGFNPDKIMVLHNFVPQASQESVVIDRESYYCYVGRLSAEKGIEQLLEAASQLPHTLKVAGSGPLEENLRNRYESCSNIEFMGQLDAHGVQQLLAHSSMSILLSQWYENNPMGVIESLMAGTPVVGTNMGGIPELITPDNGIITEIGTLRDSIDEAMTRRWNYTSIADDAHKKFSPETHLQQLLHIYGQQ